ncbi:hypothetical protein [Levilactobacillus namurensis]|uniref:Uncharacterized protein n=1 Tax=Levilactobacillus namurensis TaxID=380393 RepID=A0AAW8W9A4_9LACO|nr:hypothetical protein [Levilactobacillus namurensis]MDT7014953.1 hypothetical protein [Levilactobacillus namurensis]
MRDPYQVAYAQTVATIATRIQDLQKTLLELQKTCDLPEKWWSRVYTKRQAIPADRTAKNELYVESQWRLNYLIDLTLYLERDQVNALPEELNAFFRKRDLYWWQSALSLMGSLPYLERELVAPAYYELAEQAESTSARHRYPATPNT